MDQLPQSRPEAFSNNAMFADSQQQFHAYDNLPYSAGPDQPSYDNGWGVNSDNFALPSRGQAQSPGWASHNTANRSLHAHTGNINAQPSPYARHISQSPAPYGQQGYGNFNAAQSFQYQQSQPQYDPALFAPSHGQNLNYPTANYQLPNAGTIAPHALQSESRSPASFQAHPPQQQRANASSNHVIDQQKLIGAIPAGADAGLFSIINFDALSKATNTTRMSNFVNVGNEAVNFDCNRAAFPTYSARRSRNELRRAAGNDSRLLAKIGKKSTKMQRIASAPKTLHAANAASAQPSGRIRYEGDTASDESSSSDEDDASSYTSDDDDDSESAPLPSKRPDAPVAGTEYDTIKALWRSKRGRISADSIRKGLTDFWEIAKTIRDRWKADATAFDEAKKKGQKSQLPLLESRVKDQRDMIEAAFKAALKHGSRSIVEIMSENVSLIYLCYQFLLDRLKAEDYNSPLPRTMLELMTNWTSLTEERIEKTHVDKVLGRYSKHGDAKTKWYANKISSNAAAASKEAKENAAPAQAKKPAPAETNAASPTQRHAEPVAGVKRSATTPAGEGNAAKKVATGASKPNGATTAVKQNGVVGKTSGADTKSSTATPVPVTKTKTVAAKPSGIFSSLTAAKKPGISTTNKNTATGASTASKLAEKKAATTAPKSTFSFAETMANLTKPKEEKPAQPKPEKQLPPETPEQKAKRLRKESRRHLRVSFRRDDELTEVRYFTHDPDEELGHDASQMRDVSDVGGEGRMFKQQHQMMEVDEDDDTPEEDEKALVTFKEPGLIDFEDVDPDERARNYSHRGGGALEVESKERAEREYYDANNLIVFYTTPEDIPPNPREPSNPYSGDAVESVQQFGLPEDKFAVRAQQKRVQPNHPSGSQYQHQAIPPPNTSGLLLDPSQLAALANLQQPANNPQLPPPNAQQDIHAILAKLNANQPAPAPPQMPAFPQSFAPPQQQQQQAPQVPPTLDLAAILSQLNGAGAAPAMGGGGGFAPPMNFNPAWPQQQQQQQQQWHGGQQRGENRMSAEARANPAVNRKYKTKVCQFWQKGTCVKGEDCCYKHTEE